MNPLRAEITPVPAPPSMPDGDALARWLLSSEVGDEAGAVWSWRNEDHEGFAYPEAAALWLSWASWRREGGAPREEATGRIAARLLADLESRGGVGRGDRVYLFDTCVALDALARVRGDLDRDLPRDRIAAGFDGLTRFLDADSPVLPPTDGPPRWSETWGPHLARAAALLLRAARALDHGAAAELAREIRARSGKRGIRSDRRYLHAAVYAAEGELLARALGEPASGESPRGVAEQLARVQYPGGGLPPWSDGSGAPRSDVTAQAVRLWAAVDPARYIDRQRMALAFLARCQTPTGAVLYERDGGDRNTWSSIFASQAATWALGAPDIRELI